MYQHFYFKLLKIGNEDFQMLTDIFARNNTEIIERIILLFIVCGFF